MKVLGILLIMFVTNANSQFSALKGFNIKQPFSQLLCKVGVATDSVATQAKLKCSDLSGTGTNNPLVKTVDLACDATTGVVGGVSKILKKTCPDGSQVPSLPSQVPSLPSQVPSLPSQDPSLPTQDPSSLIQDSSSPSQDVSSSPQEDDTVTTALSSSTQAQNADTTQASPSTTTQSTSTQQQTTPTTQSPIATTPKPCTKNRIQQCKERCRRDAEVDLNLGGVCSRYAGNNQRCDCIPVKHCDTYENATCTMQCKNKEICRIPEANLPCVCKTPDGKYTTYRVPDSPFER